METNVQQWAGSVMARIFATEGGQENWVAALDANAASTGEPIPQDSAGAFEALEWLRGDEPQDAFDAGESPEDYADHLTTEWDLYGPEGE